MADDPRSLFDDVANMFPGLDADAAARMVAEVQRLGLDTARMVVDRFSDLAGRWPLTPTPSTPRDGDSAQARMTGGDAGAQQRLRADTERAVDAYLNVVRRMYDVVADLAGRAPAPPEGRGSEPLRLPPAPPGGTTSAYAWLHNTTELAADALVPRCGGLFDHAGRYLSGAAVTFDPATVPRLEPGASCSLLATLRVPVDAVPGPYHGLVLVENLPDLALPVVVEVVVEEVVVDVKGPEPDGAG